jgi:hypothetical protein
VLQFGWRYDSPKKVFSFLDLMGDCYFLVGRKVIALPSEMLGDILDPASRKHPVERPKRMKGVKSITTEDVMVELGKHVDCGRGIFFYDEDLQNVKQLKKRLHREVENLDLKLVVKKRLEFLSRKRQTGL